MRQLAGLLAFVLLISAPGAVFANHRDRDSDDNDRDWESSRIDRDDLDKEIVEHMPLPVLFGLLYAKIYPDFGDPRGENGEREHEGQDLLAPLGTPLVSPTEAIVIRTGTGDSAGKYVYTAAPGGETFRYMHLDDIADLDPGDELKAGDFIGTVGDTGNAQGGPAHLHFEIRDEDNDAVDPYPRLDGPEFTLKEKGLLLEGVFKDRRDDEEYAEFLVNTFTVPLKEALLASYELPEPIVEEFADRGILSPQAALEKLTSVIAGLPELLTMPLVSGNEGAPVVLLQFYLIYTTDGSARDALKTAGPTGFYGPVTAAAVTAYQMENGIPPTGSYDTATRDTMVKRVEDITLHLK